MSAPLRSALVLLVLLVLAGAYAALGFYQLEPDEEAIVLRLGRYARTETPGPHFYLWGIERYEKRRVTTLIEEEFGYRSVGEGAGRTFEEYPAERRMLTGDTNVVDLEFVVQYRIRDLRDFLLKVDKVPLMIRGASQAAMREVVARSETDAILGPEREAIARDAKLRIQTILNGYEAGVKVLGVQLQDVEPPQEVSAAFEEVISAEQDAERMVLEAQGYADQVVPRAHAEATELVNQAEAYKLSRLRDAEGEAAKFNALLVEYRRSPRVTRERLYLETLEAILPEMDKVIIPEGGSDRVLPYLPLGKRAESR